MLDTRRGDHEDALGRRAASERLARPLLTAAERATRARDRDTYRRPPRRGRKPLGGTCSSTVDERWPGAKYRTVLTGPFPWSIGLGAPPVEGGLTMSARPRDRETAAATAEITVFTKSGGPLSKHIELIDGKIANDSSSAMAKGSARRAQIDLGNIGPSPTSSTASARKRLTRSAASSTACRTASESCADKLKGDPPRRAAPKTISSSSRASPAVLHGHRPQRHT